MHEGSKRAIFAAFLANLGIAIAKFVGFLITGASSMLAEAIHSLADTTNQGLLFLGGKQAARPATPEHPFGYGRDRYFWSFVVALVLFSVGGVFAIYEGIEKIRQPHDIDSPAVAFTILGVAVVLEVFSLRTWFDSFTAVRSENDSSTTATPRMTNATAGESMSWGWRSFSMPSYIANRPPTENSTIATTNDQK